MNMMMTPFAWAVVVRTMKANPTTIRDKLVYQFIHECDSNKSITDALSAELIERGTSLLMMRSGFFGAPKRVSKSTDEEMWQGAYS